MAQITKEMTFSEVLRKFPKTAQVFRKYDMHCLGCLGADAETLENGAVAHGVDLKALLEDLNRTLSPG